MNDKLLSILGLCRRAGKLDWGHDTCLFALKSGKARVCLTAIDASTRTKRDAVRVASEIGDSAPPVIETQYTMEQLKNATGCFAGIFTTNDEGFAARIAELHRSNSGGNCI